MSSAVAQPPVRSSKLGALTLVVALSNLGASGFLGHLVLSGPSANACASAVVEVAVGPKTGPTVPLEGFIVNLNEPGSSRYLKASVEVEVVSEETAAELGRARPAVRDEVLRYLSNLTVGDTLGESSKSKIQSELAGRVDKVLGGGRVKRMYFSDFVVQ